jgi:hypothetical protein
LSSPTILLYLLDVAIIGSYPAQVLECLKTLESTCIAYTPDTGHALTSDPVYHIFCNTRSPGSTYSINSCVMCTCLLQNMFASSSGQLGKRLNAWVSSTVLYLTSIIYAAAALINFFGCLWYWVARREGLTNSWLTDVGELLLLLLQLVILLPAIAMRRVMHAAAANSVFIARYRHAQRCACYCCKDCFHCYALLPCAEVCIPDPRERHIFD